MQQDQFKFLLNDSVFTIPPFKRLMDISPNIQNKLIFSPQHEYSVESNVSSQIFESFIDYLINGNIPSIQISNINEYEKLSHEFDQLRSEIEQKKNEFGEHLINLNGLQEKCDDKSTYEEEIAKKLDEYVTKYGCELMKSPIQSLYNIFSHKNRKLTKHNETYEIIKEHFEKTKDSNIFILLDLLDGTKLTRNNIEESFSMFSIRNNHMPKIEFSYLSEVFSNQRKQEERIELLEKQFEQQTQKYQNNDEQKTKEYQQLFEKYQSIEQKLQEYQDLIAKQNQEYQNLFEKYQSIERQIKENEEINSKLKEQIENKIKKDEENYKEQTKEKEKLYKTIEKLQNQIEEIIKKNNNTESSIKQECKTSESKFQIFSPTKEDPFSGIINNLRIQTNNNITNEIEVTASSCLNSGERYQPHTVLLKENKDSYFATKNTPDSWLKFDFKKHRIIPTDYTIRSYICNQPKSWKIEVSNDDNTWETIDEISNDSNLKGNRLLHTYNIKHKPQKEIRYLRIFNTGKDWNDADYLVIETFEIYGTLI